MEKTYTVNGVIYSEKEFFWRCRELKDEMMKEGASYNCELLDEFIAFEEAYKSTWA